MEPRLAGPGLRVSCGCWKNRASPTADHPDGLGCLPTPSRQDPSPARPRVAGARPRARLPTADNLARGPAARARPRPRVPAIKTFRLRAFAPPAAPLPPLLAVSSLRAPRAPSVRPDPGLGIPVTDLAFHLRNRDPSDSRGSVGSARFVGTQSSGPGACHSLSPAASLANEHRG